MRSVARCVPAPTTDPVDRCRRLDPRRRVHHVAGDHRLARGRAGVERDERLTRGHADPDVKVECVVAVVERGDRVARSERRAHRPLGVVLVRNRRAVHGHDGVADELLDGPAVPLELLPQRLVVPAEKRPDVLRVEPLCTGGRADEVDEDGRDDLALLTGGGRFDQRRAAAVAEACVVRVLAAAERAGDHAASLRSRGARAVRRGLTAR
jgi:hypothetical protein